MITREQYMNGEHTHEEYYSEMAAETGIKFASEIVDRVRLSTDDHLNDIPLKVWDSYEFLYRHRMQPIAKRHGDQYSISTGVCMLKSLARIQAKQ